MRYPLDVVAITQHFGAMGVDYSQFGLKGHHGIDLVASTGTPVYAPEAGKIEASANGLNDKYTERFASGETIILIGQYEHWLMHLSSRLVQAGQFVQAGQLIGYSGNTGFSTGPHLHWGVRPLNPDLNNGYRGFIDPLTVIGGNMDWKAKFLEAEKIADERLAAIRILERQKQEVTTIADERLAAIRIHEQQKVDLEKRIAELSTGGQALNDQSVLAYLNDRLKGVK